MSDMSSVMTASSAERTYRYLRLAVAGTVVALFVAVVAAATFVGWLPSISDYFYTPARSIFVGTLITISLALVALAGNGVERVLLDAAALFAPLIALVPTTVAPGTVPGVEVTCPRSCFPAAYTDDVAVGVVVYLVLHGLGIAASVLLVAARQVRLRTVWLSLLFAVALLVAVAYTWFAMPALFLMWAHYVAAFAFFGFFAAAAVLAAFPRRGARPGMRFRVAYTAIAVGLVVVLIVFAALIPESMTIELPVVLLSETAALILFLVFWIVQCVEKWRNADGVDAPARPVARELSDARRT